MKLLCFQAKRFRWKTHSKTLPEVADQDLDQEVCQTVVVFLHAEAADGDAERSAAVLRQSLKHVKWLANKRELKNIVLHSFTHLGGETAPAGAGRIVYYDIAAALERDRLPSLDHALRLFLRVGFERVRREPRQSLERDSLKSVCLTKRCSIPNPRLSIVL